MALINGSTVRFYDVELDRWGNVVKEWHKDHQTPVITFMHDWNEDNNDYYVIEFRKSPVLGLIPLEELLTEQQLNKLKQSNSNFYLVVANSHEAFLSCVQDVYSGLVDRYSIPAHKIILMTGAFEAGKLNEEIVAERDNQDSIKIKIIVDFEKGAQNTLEYFLGHKKLKFAKTLEQKHYDKSFLNFNRRWRHHRPLFVAMLKMEGLLDKGLVSFGPSDDNRGWDETHPTLVHMLRQDGHRDLARKLDNMKKELERMPPMYLDHKELVTNRAEFLAQDDWMYADTYFSLVSETHYFERDEEHGIFFSEKVFKPISFRHPFILIAPCGSLAALKSIGYKGFAPYINEDYDKIKNDVNRMEAIIKETKRLDALEGDELTEWLHQCKKICDYNFNVLYKKDKYDFAHKVNY